MFSRFIPIAALLALALPTLSAQTAAPSAPPATPAEPMVYAPQPTPASEDWSTISLAKSGLPLGATGGVLLSKIEQPDCTRELLRLQWRTGDPIDLYVIRPHTPAKPPVTLYLYNYTEDSDLFRQDAWCSQAAHDQIAIAGFVSALAGQRFHSPRPMKQWFISELQEALSTSTHDVQMILNYLDSRGDLDMKHVGMFGQGSGGSIAILAAAADPRIVALDVIDPWGDWPDWLKDSKEIPEGERAAYLKPEFLSKVAPLDPVTYLPHLTVPALRVQQLMDDPVTPARAKDKIAAAAPRENEVTRYPDMGAYKKFRSINEFSGWMREHLYPTLVLADR